MLFDIDSNRTRPQDKNPLLGGPSEWQSRAEVYGSLCAQAGLVPRVYPNRRSWAGHSRNAIPYVRDNNPTCPPLPVPTVRERGCRVAMGWLPVGNRGRNTRTGGKNATSCNNTRTTNGPVRWVLPGIYPASGGRGSGDPRAGQSTNATTKRSVSMRPEKRRHDRINLQQPNVPPLAGVSRSDGGVILAKDSKKMQQNATIRRCMPMSQLETKSLSSYQTNQSSRQQKTTTLRQHLPRKHLTMKYLSKKEINTMNTKTVVATTLWLPKRQKGCCFRQPILKLSY